MDKAETRVSTRVRIRSSVAASSSGPWRQGWVASWRGSVASGRLSPSPSLSPDQPSWQRKDGGQLV